MYWLTNYRWYRDEVSKWNLKNQIRDFFITVSFKFEIIVDHSAILLSPRVWGNIGIFAPVCWIQVNFRLCISLCLCLWANLSPLSSALGLRMKFGNLFLFCFRKRQTFQCSSWKVVLNVISNTRLDITYNTYKFQLLTHF